MANLRRGTVVLGVALGITGCFFPSFDGMSGGTSGATDPVTDPGSDGSAPTSSADATVEAAVEASSNAPNAPNTPDAGAQPKVEFACDDVLCELGKQMCCTHMVDPWECRTIGPRGDCDAVPQCTDSADCKGAGESCCYDTDARVGSCKTGSCSGSKELVLCNQKKPTCKNNGMCTGNWFGMNYCI